MSLLEDIIVNKNEKNNAFEKINDRIAESVSSLIDRFLQEQDKRVLKHEIDGRFGNVMKEIEGLRFRTNNLER